MFDPSLYREACRELRAPEDKIEEILAMKERKCQKYRRHLGGVMVAAAAIALMAVGVSAANPDVFQDFIYQIVSVVNVDQFRRDLTTDQGEQVAVFSIPEVTVVNRDGRAVLSLDGEETDITDALEERGRYEYQQTEAGSQLTVLVEGSPEKWVSTLSLGEPGGETPLYSFTSDSEGSGSLLSGGSHLAIEAGADGAGVASVYDGKKVTQLPAGG